MHQKEEKRAKMEQTIGLERILVHKNDDKLCACTAVIVIDVTAMSLMMSNVEVDIIMVDRTRASPSGFWL